MRLDLFAAVLECPARSVQDCFGWGLGGEALAGSYDEPFCSLLPGRSRMASSE